MENKNNDLISIIVPVYNVESYLKRCVDSLLSQTIHNYEILLIDDGSTDESGYICDIYSKKYSFVKTFHKENGGLSDARNYGIDRASGAYLTFVDSDDYVRNDYLEILYNLIIINKADISIGVWKEVYDDGSEKTIYPNRKKIEITDDNNVMLEKMLYQKLFDTSACAKLYKKELFCKIKFPKGKLYEDLATIYKTFLLAKRISYTNEPIYYYYKRINSITNSCFKEKDLDLLEISETLLNDINNYERKNNLNGFLKKAAVTRYLSSNFSILLKVKNEDKYKSIREKCYSNIRKYYSINRKARIKNNIALVLFKLNPKLIK